MSTTTPDTIPPASANTVTLPPGVTIGAGRETTQANPQGLIVQGMLYPLTLPGGTTTTVFIPYTAITDAAQVQALFLARINALQAIPVSSPA